MATQETFMQIYKLGTYYNPATNHYGRTDTSVVCDRCKRTNLNVCIGWLTYDLCLKCVQDIDSIKAYTPPVTIPTPDYGDLRTLMMQSQFTPSTYGTKMEQSQYTPSSSPVYTTRMMQTQFRNTSPTQYITEMHQNLFDSASDIPTFCTKMEQNQFSSKKK